MNYPPLTLEKALTLGFLQFQGMKTVMSHTAYPGIAFKLIENNEQSDVIGGIALISLVDTAQVLYFGLTAVRCVAAGTLGRFSVPSHVDRDPDPVFGPSKLFRAPSQLEGYYSSVYTVSQRSSVDLFTSAGTIGILSRADSGFVLNRPFDSLALPIVWGFGSPVVAYNGLADGQWQSQNFSGQNLARVCVDPGGYIAGLVKVDKKTFLVEARTNFLAGLSSDSDATSEIIAKYSDAYDTLISGAVGVVEDGVYLDASVKSGQLYVSAGKRAHTAAPVPFSCGPQLFGRCVAIVPQDSTTYESGSATINVTARGFGDGWDSISNMPMIGCTLSLQTAGSGVDMKLRSNGSTFSLASVPYTHVQLSIQKLPVGSLIGLISPSVRPSDATSTITAPENVLDLRERITADISGTMGNFQPLTLVKGATDAASQVVIANANLVENARLASIDRMIPTLLPFSQFIVGSVNSLDKMVRA